MYKVNRNMATYAPRGEGERFLVGGTNAPPPKCNPDLPTCTNVTYQERISTAKWYLAWTCFAHCFMKPFH